MTSPGPAGRASREERIEAAARAMVWEFYMGCVSWEDTNDTATTGDEHTRKMFTRLAEVALDRLSPSGEGEERQDADQDSHERGFARGDEPGGSPSRSGPATDDGADCGYMGSWEHDSGHGAHWGKR